MGISDFLEDQQSAGHSHSEGSFTISLRESLKKLRQYQFRQPEVYVLLLVSAAIAQGADAVDVREDSRVLTLTFPGCSFTRASLEHLHRALISDLQAQAHRLTLGLLGAKNCVDGAVVLTSSSPEGVFRWTVETDGGKLKQTRDGAPPSTTVEIYRHSRLKGLFRRLNGYAGLSPEGRLLYSRCERSLTNIYIQGELIRRPPMLGEVAALTTVGYRQVVAAPFYRYDIPGKSWRGILVLANRPLFGDSGLQVVCLGVSYPLPKVEWLQGLVWHDGLTTDLSQAGILQDAACSEMLEDFLRIQERMLAGLAMKLPSLTLTEVRHLRQLLGMDAPSNPTLKAFYKTLEERHWDLLPTRSSSLNVDLEQRAQLTKAVAALESGQLGIALLEFNKVERTGGRSPAFKGAAILGDAICRQLLTGEPHLGRGFSRLRNQTWEEIPKLCQAAEAGMENLRAAFFEACARLLDPLYGEERKQYLWET